MRVSRPYHWRVPPEHHEWMVNQWRRERARSDAWLRRRRNGGGVGTHARPAPRAHP
jgi:hypothetical protein